MVSKGDTAPSIHLGDITCTANCTQMWLVSKFKHATSISNTIFNGRLSQKDQRVFPDPSLPEKSEASLTRQPQLVHRDKGPKKGDRLQRAFIFDWDDTLLCTSFLKAYDKNLPLPLAQCLETIANAAKELLLQSLQLGYTFIITNARTTWVENTAKEYLPELLPVLQNVSIISARSAHEIEYPDVAQWKIQAFFELAQSIELEKMTDLIVVGDSYFEIDAAMAVYVSSPQSLRVKTVKLYTKPSPEELMKQLQALTRNLRSIVDMDRSVNINLRRLDSPTHMAGG